MKLIELFDKSSSLSTKWEIRKDGAVTAIALDKDGSKIKIWFNENIHPATNGRQIRVVDISFSKGGSYAITGTGNVNTIFATVLTTIREYLKKHKHPDFFIFTGDEPSRQKLYSRMIKRFSGITGYTPFSYESLLKMMADITPEERNSILKHNEFTVFVMKKDGG